MSSKESGPDDEFASPRIVSLLPSITEILCELGLSKNIVGITHECDHPPHLFRNAGPRVVTTSEINPHTMSQAEINAAVCGSLRNGDSLYGIDAGVLRDVRPDLVLSQSLCDVCAVSYGVVLDTCARLIAPAGEPTGEGEAGGKVNPAVISMEPQDLADCLKTFHVAATAVDDQIAKLGGGGETGEPAGATTTISARAEQLTTSIERDLDRIRAAVHGRPRPTVAFFEWHDPIFCGGHWIVDMLDIAGGDYVMPVKRRGRSVAMSDGDFEKLDPDVILIGPCGFSLERCAKDTQEIFAGNPAKRDWWNGLRAVRDGRVYALDGNSYYARPGPRLLQGTAIMAACLHGQDVADALGEDLVPVASYIRIKTPS